MAPGEGKEKKRKEKQSFTAFHSCFSSRMDLRFYGYYYFIFYIYLYGGWVVVVVVVIFGAMRQPKPFACRHQLGAIDWLIAFSILFLAANVDTLLTNECAIIIIIIIPIHLYIPLIRTSSSLPFINSPFIPYIYIPSLVFFLVMSVCSNSLVFILFSTFPKNKNVQQTHHTHKHSATLRFLSLSPPPPPLPLSIITNVSNHTFLFQYCFPNFTFHSTLHSFPSKILSHDNLAATLASLANSAASMGHHTPTAANAGVVATVTTEMTIPNDVIGSIIGKGGAKINEIR